MGDNIARTHICVRERERRDELCVFYDNCVKQTSTRDGLYASDCVRDHYSCRNCVRLIDRPIAIYFTHDEQVLTVDDLFANNSP